MSTHIINPQNPYVFNENLFANQPHLNFKGSPYALFLHVIDTGAPLLGILAACMVSYLAIFQTPSHIKAFSRMILLCSMTDIIYASVDLFCQVRLQPSEAGAIFSFNGPASLFDYQLQCRFMVLGYIAHMLGFLILPLQYIFRYQTFKRNSPPSLLKTSVYVFVCLLISMLNIWTVSQAFCSFENPNHIDFGQYWYKEVPIPTLLISIQNYPPAVHQMQFFTAVIFVSYILAIYYARRTVTELKKQSASMSARTLAMQKQIGKALFAQSLIPLLTVIVPLVCGQLSLQLDIDMGYFSDICHSLVSFFPLLNALSTLYFISPYKKYCQRNLLCCFYLKPNRTTTSTSAVVTVAN